MLHSKLHNNTIAHNIQQNMTSHSSCTKMYRNTTALPLHSLFLHKNSNQPMHQHITAVSKITKYFELILHQYVRVVTYILHMGVGRIFPGGWGKSGEIWFLPLEIKKTTFFC